jgi:hypothetical protein
MDCSSTTRQPAPPQPKLLPAPPPQVSWMLVACPIHQTLPKTKQQRPDRWAKLEEPTNDHQTGRGLNTNFPLLSIHPVVLISFAYDA